MTMSRAALAAGAYGRLDIPSTSRYLIEVPQTPPTISPTDQRVRAYTVLHPSAGVPTDQRNQADQVLEHQWTFQINAVVGDPNDLLALVDAVTAAFEGWQPIDRPDCGVCRQVSDIGTALTDNAKTPPRHWLPLIYQVNVGDTITD